VSTILKIDVRPPNKPWVKLEKKDDRSVLAYFLSDPNTKIPIRDVSNKNDPKPDPNVETETFGLFSYCHRKMRKSMVEYGINLLFFCTRRREQYVDDNGKKRFKGKRVIAGYYRIGWYYEIEKGDFMLAACESRFINPGYPLEMLKEFVGDESIANNFRDYKYLNPNITQRLSFLMNATPNKIDDHISEIHTYEAQAKEKYGYMYRTRKTGFNWEDAPRPMKIK